MYVGVQVKNKNRIRRLLKYEGEVANVQNRKQ